MKRTLVITVVGLVSTLFLLPGGVPAEEVHRVERGNLVIL